MSTTAPVNDVNIEAVAGLAAKIQSEPEVAATRWQAAVTWNGAFRSEARVREFAPIASDEPAGLGGSDSAPNPVEQLLASLGNCLAVGYAANATVAGIEINKLTIDLEGDIDLRTFLGLANDNAGFSGIRATVHLDADATPQQVAELHEKVTGSSPVGHTLCAPVPLDIRLG